MFSTHTVDSGHAARHDDTLRGVSGMRLSLSLSLSHYIHLAVVYCAAAEARERSVDINHHTVYGLADPGAGNPATSLPSGLSVGLVPPPQAEDFVRADGHWTISC